MKLFLSYFSVLRHYSASHIHEIAQRAHVPVLLNEALAELHLRPGQTLLDMTFGAGGHSLAALRAVPDLRVFALDCDPEAHRYAYDLSQSYPGQVVPLLGRFSDLPRLSEENNIALGSIDAILFDLGCSSIQFDQAHRGFALSKDGPLDMRMEGAASGRVTAADVVAYANEGDLWRIFKYYGEEKHCKIIARAIVESRFAIEPVQSTLQLAKLVEMVCGFSFRRDKLYRRSHVATKVFQALRIFVNNEVNELNYGLLLARRFLRHGGRLVAIAFHSIEDRIVKRHLQDNVVDNAVSPLPLRYSSCAHTFNMDEMYDFKSSFWDVTTKHIVIPTSEEVSRNPRARSARLRAAIKAG